MTTTGNRMKNIDVGKRFNVEKEIVKYSCLCYVLRMKYIKQVGNENGIPLSKGRMIRKSISEHFRFFSIMKKERGAKI